MAAKLTPEELLTRVRPLALALPESTEAPRPEGAEFKVRRSTFAHVLTVVDPAGNEVTMLVCRADPEEREVLRAIGHPFFIPGSGRDRVGVLLDHSTDWDELAELITESYLLLAPQKLAALVDAPPLVERG